MEIEGGIRLLTGKQILSYARDDRSKAGATADEVDDLEAVALLESGLRPAVAGDDITVELYGHAVGFHAELIEQVWFLPFKTV